MVFEWKQKNTHICSGFLFSDVILGIFNIIVEMLIGIVTSKVKSNLKLNDLILHRYLSLRSNGLKLKMTTNYNFAFSLSLGDKIESFGRARALWFLKDALYF